MTVRELRDLREATANRDTRNRVPPNVLEQPAREVAHVQHRLDREPVQLLHRLLRRTTGAAGDMGKAHRARHVHPALDRVDPRRARVRDDDPGGAEDREPSDDSEGAGSRSSRRAVRRPATPISTITSPGAPCAAATSATVSRIIRRGTGLIAGSPTGTGSPGRVTVPTPGPARNATPLPGAPSRTVEWTSARWVTSGSSPASLTTPARA